MRTFNFTGAYGLNDGFNIVPRAVIVIGKTPVLCLSYDLTTNTQFESDTLTVKFASKYLNYNKLYLESLTLGGVVPIEVWSGFLDSRAQHAWTYDYVSNSYVSPDSGYKSNEHLKHYLLQNYQKLLTRSWVGIVKQPKMTLAKPDNPDITTLICGDFSHILRKYRFEKQYKGDAGTVKNVIADINKNLKNFEFVLDGSLDKKVLTHLLGYKKKIKKDADSADTKETEIKYSTTGKSYWDILRHITERTRTTIIPDVAGYKTGEKIKYTIVPRARDVAIWDLQRANHWESGDITLGRFGDAAPSAKIAVQITSVQTKSNKVITGQFPPVGSADTSPEGQHLFKYNGPVDLSKEECDSIAFDYAQNIGKQQINGNIFIPNAITELQPADLIRLKDNNTLNPNRQLNELSDVLFQINSLTESFNLTDGLTQKVEFEVNYNSGYLNPTTGKYVTLLKLPSETKQGQVDSKFLPPDIEDLPEYLQKFRRQGLI